MLSTCINNGGDKPLCIPKDLKKAESGGYWTDEEKQDALDKMEEIFGSGANCTANFSGVYCYPGYFLCETHPNGDAMCQSSSFMCQMYSNDSIVCGIRGID